MEALGETPALVRAGLMIPRGERLRQTLSGLDHPADDDDATPSAGFVRDLRVLVAAYTGIEDIPTQDRTPDKPCLLGWKIRIEARKLA